jgi:hypothetical protein
MAQLDVSLRFPANVFVGPWDSFWFFDSDRLLDPEFVSVVTTLLDAEGAHCASIVKLDSSDGARENSEFVIHRDVSTDQYRKVLRGDRAGYGWIHDLDRLGCTSDRGQWTIYCEPQAEVAVIAISKDAMWRLAAVASELLHAVPIEEALRQVLSWGFSRAGLSDEWRATLLREYGTTPGTTEATS